MAAKKANPSHAKNESGTNYNDFIEIYWEVIYMKLKDKVLEIAVWKVPQVKIYVKFKEIANEGYYRNRKRWRPWKG